MPARSIINSFLAFAILLAAAGCAAPKFAPVNLQDPGWSVIQTQAIWRPEKGAPEITGDLLLATNSSGRAFISFSKTLPLITAQSSPEGWSFEAPENHHYSAPGKPPARIVWFQIAPALGSQLLPKRWHGEKLSDSLVLSNENSGERLEIILPQP